MYLGSQEAPWSRLRSLLGCPAAISICSVFPKQNPMRSGALTCCIFRNVSLFGQLGGAIRVHFGHVLAPKRPKFNNNWPRNHNLAGQCSKIKIGCQRGTQNKTETGTHYLCISGALPFPKQHKCKFVIVETCPCARNTPSKKRGTHVVH